MSKQNYFIIIAFSLVVIVSYILLFGKYRPAEVDDAWTASYVWNITHEGSVKDTVFGAVSNVQYFGHIHAKITGFIADIAGWSKSTFHLINLFCVILAATAWFFIAAKVFDSRKQAVIFVLLLFALEPFLGAAYKARSDAMAFFFVSWGLMAAVYGRFFIATFIVSLAVEIHAISCIGYFWILAVLARNFVLAEYRIELVKKQIIMLVLGGLVGFVVYRLMHPDAISEIFTYLLSSNTDFISSFNALTAHYFHREYCRFIPELIFWIVGCILFFRYKKQIFNIRNLELNLFWVTIVTSLLMQRANAHYVIFFYPPLFMLAFAGYWQSILRYPALIALLLYAAALSGTLYYQNRHVDHASFDRNMLAADITLEGVTVIGPSNAWFVLREGDFYISYEAMLKDQGIIPDFIYYIASPYSRQMPSCSMPVENIHNFMFNRQKVEVFLMDLHRCSEN